MEEELDKGSRVMSDDLPTGEVVESSGGKLDGFDLNEYGEIVNKHPEYKKPELIKIAQIGDDATIKRYGEEE